LTGVVTNAENGQPLPGARLTTILDAGAALSRWGGVAVADPEGRFELRTSAGAWNLTVQFPEFREQRLPVELVPGEFRSGLAVALAPETAESD